jgi:hypothetical protein
MGYSSASVPNARRGASRLVHPDTAHPEAPATACDRGSRLGAADVPRTQAGSRCHAERGGAPHGWDFLLPVGFPSGHPWHNAGAERRAALLRGALPRAARLAHTVGSSGWFGGPSVRPLGSARRSRRRTTRRGWPAQVSAPAAPDPSRPGCARGRCPTRRCREPGARSAQRVRSPRSPPSSAPL